MQTCTEDANAKRARSRVQLPAPDVGALERFLMEGPLVSGVAADSLDFQLYAGGIFDGQCSVELDHAISLVGFSSLYWILRNSWGTGWGEDGFMRMRRSVSQRCGLLTASIAITAGHGLRRPLLV